MRAFFDPASDLHRPIHRIAGGVLKPTYETAERTRMLLAGLAGIGVQAQAPARDDAALDRLLARVHDGDYLAFLRDGFAKWAQNPANGPELRTSIHANRYMDRKPRDRLDWPGIIRRIPVRFWSREPGPRSGERDMRRWPRRGR